MNDPDSLTDTLAGRHVCFLSWRDTRNPEGGGAELYLEQVAAGMVARGCRVTIFCAAHDAAPGDETRGGIRFVRRGGKLTVYLRGMLLLLLGRLGPLGRPDLVVDVQNGLPFFTRLVTRAPVLVLVHHVHREQWPVVYPGVTGRVGWWIERRVAPRLYRGCQYVAVSEATRDELVELGVDAERTAVVHNGTEPVVPFGGGKAAEPTIAVVGRLVPHKQVEHAIDAVRELRRELPDLRLQVVGDGWWADQLHEYAASQQVEVEFTGQIDEVAKQLIYERAWVLALPSLKEGWGLVIGEAGAHWTPAVAYRSAGGTQESIREGASGVLVDTQAEFVIALRGVLTDSDLRARLGAGAHEMSREFSWARNHEAFAHVVGTALDGERTAARDQSS